jgi:hypothetical protein
MYSMDSGEGRLDGRYPMLQPPAGRQAAHNEEQIVRQRLSEMMRDSKGKNDIERMA